MYIKSVVCFSGSIFDYSIAAVKRIYRKIELFSHDEFTNARNREFPLYRSVKHHLLFDLFRCYDSIIRKGKIIMNWKNIVAEIKGTGLTQAQIAESMGVATGTLSELCSGKVIEPKWSRGNALLALYAKRVTKRAAKKSV